MDSIFIIAIESHFRRSTKLSDFRWFFLLWGRGYPEGAWQGGTPAELGGFLRAHGQAAALAAGTHAALSDFKGSTRILQPAG